MRAVADLPRPSMGTQRRRGPSEVANRYLFSIQNDFALAARIRPRFTRLSTGKRCVSTAAPIRLPNESR